MVQERMPRVLFRQQGAQTMMPMAARRKPSKLEKVENPCRLAAA
jgi:hypothetical protein